MTVVAVVAAATTATAFEREEESGERQKLVQRPRMAPNNGDEEDGSEAWLPGSSELEAGANPGEATSLAGLPSMGGTLADGDFWLEPLQQWAGIASHILALAGTVLVCMWVSDLGGVSWKQGESKLVFNWHPVCMIIAFLFMTISALSFRVKWRCNRNVSKILHIVEWTTAGLCMAVGLVAVFKSHNDPVSGYIANLYSLHSWIGIAVLILYTLQFFVGVFSFGMDIQKIDQATKYKIMLLHKFMGPFIYVAVAATILLGIQEKEGFIGCNYEVTEPDLFPAAHLSEIPRACKISHSLGIVILVTTLSTAFALHDFRGAGSGQRND